MSYESGLSGLDAAANDLDVIGNNIANADTVGFKESTAEFADVYANTIASTVNDQIGIGTQLAAVSQNFSQGQVTTNGVAWDVAINGQGFFQMSNNGSVSYSRDGEFHVAPNGDVENENGLNLMGYQASTAGVLNTGQLVPLNVPQMISAPQASANITADMNLGSQDTIPSIVPFSATTPGSYNTTTTAQVYDSLGGTQDVTMYFVKTGPNAWDVYGGVQGGAVSQLGTVGFSTSGALNATTATAPATSSGTGFLSFTIPNTDGSATPQALTLNLNGTTQYGTGDSTTSPTTADGWPPGQLTNYTVAQNGMITGTYSNGQTTTIGQIALANFANPQGLQNLSGNQYEQTVDSGTPLIGVPGTSDLGSLQGGATEASNVDLTAELVDLITAQRNYQANAQTIKTQQTVDQTILQL
jgi:flagellar hook protein FlgE